MNSPWVSSIFTVDGWRNFEGSIFFCLFAAGSAIDTKCGAIKAAVQSKLYTTHV